MISWGPHNKNPGWIVVDISWFMVVFPSKMVEAESERRMFGRGQHRGPRGFFVDCDVLVAMRMLLLGDEDVCVFF